MGMTKTKRRQREKMFEREKRVARGLPAKPNPPKYIPRYRPVIGAMTREERDDEARRSDAAAAEEMKVKIAKQVEAEENMRFQFDGLKMSDRVRKLFALKNGSQREVVWSQKRRGMEVSDHNCIWCFLSSVTYVIAAVTLPVRFFFMVMPLHRKLFQLREGDTGSSAVQVVALTTRIQQLQTHMAKHHKDKSTKRGLDALFVRRRKVLDYMERKSFESYRKVVKSLGLVR
jgi:small subunit ribosomal protein S15